MTHETLWVTSEVAFALAALAAATCAVAIARRAPRGRETGLVVASLGLLAAHYGVMTADAWLQATGAAGGRFTVWSVVGQTLATLAYLAVILCLLSVVTRIQPPERRRAPVVQIVLVQVGIVCVATLGLLLWVVDKILRGAPAETVQTSVDRVVVSWGLVTPLLVAAPLVMAHILWEHRPTARRVVWTGTSALEGRWHGAGWDTGGALVDRGPSFVPGDMRGLIGIYAGVAVLELLRWVSRSTEWTAVTVALHAVCRVALLPCAVGVIYYHARFVFFTVVLKRGLVFLGLCAVVGPAIWTLLARSLPAPTTALASVAVTLLIYACAGGIERAHQWLDRVIFRRPHDRDELQTLLGDMARSRHVPALTETVTAALARLFSTTDVEYGPEAADAAHVAVVVGTADRPRGYLSLGSRARGQQYSSEDLTCLTAVAAQFTALLEGFDAREAAALVTAAEARALRAQINPHFVFNALNTVAEMVQGTPAAERTVLNLSTVCQYALDSTRHERVPLRAELAAIRAYLDIEAERFEDRLSFEIDVPEEVLGVPIPPMLLQPLVENAVTHGLGPSLRGGTVRVSARRADARLFLTVSDDGIGFAPETMTPHVGLSNVRARVEAAGGHYELRSTPGGGTIVTLQMGIR